MVVTEATPAAAARIDFELIVDLLCAVAGDEEWRAAADTWHRDALCQEDAYADLRWGDDRGPDVEVCREVCARCLVRAECLEAAPTEPGTGIWAGMSSGQRKKAAAGRRGANQREPGAPTPP